MPGISREPFTIHFHHSDTRCEPCVHPQAGPGSLNHRKILEGLQLKTFYSCSFTENTPGLV